MAEETKATPEAPAKAENKVEEKAPQNEIQKELERVQRGKTYTDQERAAFNLKKQAEKAKELGIDPLAIIGGEDKPTDEIPDWYKKEKAKEAEKTSFQLADELSDPDERALTREYLANRIRSQGNPQDDFRLALSAVRALKNKEILEDVQRRINPRRTASGGSANAEVKTEFVPTKQEAIFMRPPYNLTQKQIEDARRKAQDNQK